MSHGLTWGPDHKTAENDLWSCGENSDTWLLELFPHDTFFAFQCESLAKKEEMQCSFKVPQAYRSPTGFSFNFFAALKIPLSSRKKWCFQKQAKNLKTCYVLHCRRMQRCWALWTLSGWHKYIFIISTPKSTKHSRASVEGREMYSILYPDDRFYL